MTRRQAVLAGCGLAATPMLYGQGRQSNPPSQLAGAAQAEVRRVNLFDYEQGARERLPHTAWEYINCGAGDEITLRWNREAFDQIRVRPQILVDVSKLDTRVTLFGQELPFPILLAPAAYHRIVHPEGELATVRGAGTAGATMVVSSLATTAMEEIARAATQPWWFQLYAQPDRGFTRDLVQRAEAAGCRALCLTVDQPVRGARNREQRAGFRLPPELDLPNLKGLPLGDRQPFEVTIYSALMDSRLTWKDIDRLRSFAKVPVLLKGVLNPDDAEKAVQAGASGLIVSNHGARNLDTLPATLHALPAVAERVAGRIPVLMDGGVRRGTDVLKALAMGAKAVLIGRPYLYGLGVAGAEGVSHVITILRRELEMAMALTGRTSIGSIDRTVLW